MTIICPRVKPLRWGGGGRRAFCCRRAPIYILSIGRFGRVVFFGWEESEAAGNALSQTLRENRMDVHLL